MVWQGRIPGSSVRAVAGEELLHTWAAVHVLLWFETTRAAWLEVVPLTNPNSRPPQLAL